MVYNRPVLSALHFLCNISAIQQLNLLNKTRTCGKNTPALGALTLYYQRLLTLLLCIHSASVAKALCLQKFVWISSGLAFWHTHHVSLWCFSLLLMLPLLICHLAFFIFFYFFVTFTPTYALPCTHTHRHTSFLEKLPSPSIEARRAQSQK